MQLLSSKNTRSRQKFQHCSLSCCCCSCSCPDKRPLTAGHPAHHQCTSTFPLAGWHADSSSPSVGVMLATLSAAERVPDVTVCYLSVIAAGHTEHRSKCMHRIERIPQGESPRVTDTTVRRQKHHAVAMLGCNLVQDVLPLDPPLLHQGGHRQLTATLVPPWRRAREMKLHQRLSPSVLAIT